MTGSFHAVRLSRAVVPIAVALSISAVTVHAQDPIDILASDCPESYKPFAHEQVETQGCYGVYYINAGATLASRSSENNPRPLSVVFSLPAHFHWGNWLSIRRQFTAPVDLSDATGLEFPLTIVASSGTSMRMTLSDVDGSARDDLWWADLGPILGKEGSDVVRVPFSSFRRCSGDGCRLNDGRLNLSRVIAYEFNLLSGPGATEKGSLVIDILRPY